MRKYVEKISTERVTEDIVCNMCGQPLAKDASGYFFDCLSIDKTWGYLSGWDGETHSFDICGPCYAGLIKGFSVPVTVEEP